MIEITNHETFNARLAAVLAEYPRLDANGMYWEHGGPRPGYSVTPEERAGHRAHLGRQEWFDEWPNSRTTPDALYRPFYLHGEVFRAMVWLQRAVTPTGRISKRWSGYIGSYGHKHAAERWAGAYISNGSLICAALMLGLRVRRLHPRDNLNAKIG